jgi:hypothetical protein
MDNFPSQRTGANFKREQQADGRWVIIYAPNGWDESDKTKRGLTVVKPGQSIEGKGIDHKNYKDDYLKLRQEHYDFLKKYDKEHDTEELKGFVHESEYPIDRGKRNRDTN